MSTDDREFRRKARVAYHEMGKEASAQGMGNLMALAAFVGGGYVVALLTQQIWLAAGAALVTGYVGYWFGKKFAPLLAILLLVGIVAAVAWGLQNSATSANNPPQPVGEQADKTLP